MNLFWRLPINLNKKLAPHSPSKSCSYNIAARYFIRPYQKSMSENSWVSLQAKVPVVAKRTSQTLSSLISLHQAIKSPRVA
ncbi:hypothetical protein RZN25_09060 [Bacillaceae bacterium S4-13-56]